MSNPNPPNKLRRVSRVPQAQAVRPGAVNHLTTARVKTERNAGGTAFLTRNHAATMALGWLL